jgi:subtilisin family serine protease
VRRSMSILSVVAVAVAGLAAGPLPATAAPASQAHGTAAAAVPDELLVGYAPGTRPGERERARRRADAQRQERVVAGAADRREVELVRLPPGKDRDEAIAQLESDPAVHYAEPNYLLTHQGKPGGDKTSTADYFGDGSLWGMYGDASTPANSFGSQAAEVWPAGHVGSVEVYVGVIDEGIQLDHPDLDGQVWTNPHDVAGNGVDDDGNGYVDDVHGWDFAGDDNTVYDGGTRGNLDDHGTHVAGTIAARPDRDGVVGVNHQVTLISGKFLGRNGGTLANAVKAVDYFTDLKTRGVNVVATNNSWGGGAFSQTLLDAIVSGAHQDILFVAAAGNSGSDNDETASYPSSYDTTACPAGQQCDIPAGGWAAYDAVTAVAAIDSQGALASFSQYGATTVDLGAPGVGIWSTTAYNEYSSYNGTSMATPHVTGAAALYAAATPGSSAAQIRQALLSSVQPTAALTGKTATGGRLDVAQALVPAQPTAPAASFTADCTGLSCTFRDTSSGSPTTWAWDFGDGTTSAEQHPSHAFSAAGDYRVTLTATNDMGSSTATQTVTVTEIARTVTVTAGAKTRNVTPVTVRWAGFAGKTVEVTRSGSTITTANDGELTEDWRGSGTVTYTVCEVGGGSCESASTTI